MCLGQFSIVRVSADIHDEKENLLVVGHSDRLAAHYRHCHRDPWKSRGLPLLLLLFIPNFYTATRKHKVLRRGSGKPLDRE